MSAIATKGPTGLRAPDLLDGSWILALFLRRWSLAPWKLAVMGWFAYYFVPMIAAMIWGVFLPPDFARHSNLRMLLPSEAVVQWLSRGGIKTLPYLTDLTHFAMASVAILLGGGLVMKAVMKFQGVFSFLLESNQIEAPRSALALEIRKLHQRCQNRPMRWTILIMAIVLASVMFSKTRASGLEYWWGHSSHGPAGAIFCVACGAALYFGGICLWLLTIGLNAISAVFRHPIQLRPFHPDGCNGFQRVGNYIIFLFCLCLTMAASIWITLGLGYLQIEDFFATWFVALSAIFVIPIILIKPLVRITSQIRKARFEKLSKIDQRLQRLLTEFEKHLSDADDATLWRKSLPELLEARHAMDSVYSSNVFPFSSRIAGTLSVGYLLQAALFVREFVEKLHLHH